MACGDFKDLNKKQLLIKFYAIMHLILLKIQNMMDINVHLLQWFVSILIKKLLVEQLKRKLYLIKKYVNQLFENLKQKKYTHLL